MLKKIKHSAKEILLFIIIITVTANLISLYKSSELNKNPLDINTLQLHNSIKFDRDTTKPLLIHIWALWCPTCITEASNIQTLSKDYQVLTIAVKSGSNKDIDKYLKENNYNFNIVNDSDGSLSSTFNVQVFPTTIIYNKNKEVVFSDVGYTSTWGLYLRMWWASL